MLDAKVDGWSTRIEDSLAICEFLAESEPELGLWPKDRKLRALARSACAQMHSGFNEIRNTYHTNFVGKYIGDVPMTNQGEKEIKRMLSLWSMIRASTIDRLKELDQADDGFLFGKFSIADAFFWPVLWVRQSRGNQPIFEFDLTIQSFSVFELTISLLPELQ